VLGVYVYKVFYPYLETFSVIASKLSHVLCERCCGCAD